MGPREKPWVLVQRPKNKTILYFAKKEEKSSGGKKKKDSSRASQKTVSVSRLARKRGNVSVIAQLLSTKSEVLFFFVTQHKKNSKPLRLNYIIQYNPTQSNTRYKNKTSKKTQQTNPKTKHTHTKIKKRKKTNSKKITVFRTSCTHRGPTNTVSIVSKLATLYNCPNSSLLFEL